MSLTESAATQISFWSVVILSGCGVDGVFVVIDFCSDICGLGCMTVKLDLEASLAAILDWKWALGSNLKVLRLVVFGLGQSSWSALWLGLQCKFEGWCAEFVFAVGLHAEMFVLVLDCKVVLVSVSGCWMGFWVISSTKESLSRSSFSQSSSKSSQLFALRPQDPFLSAGLSTDCRGSAEVEVAGWPFTSCEQADAEEPWLSRPLTFWVEQSNRACSSASTWSDDDGHFRSFTFLGYEVSVSSVLEVFPHSLRLLLTALSSAELSLSCCMFSSNCLASFKRSSTLLCL